jgi:hypothetical protein
MKVLPSRTSSGAVEEIHHSDARGDGGLTGVDRIPACGGAAGQVMA